MTTTPSSGTWTIDTSHSYIGWTVEHYGVARLYGRFTRFTGALIVDPDDVLRSQCSVEIDASSVESADPGREDLVRGDRFLDIENHPQLRFVSSSIAPVDGAFQLAGEFTMRGVTKPLSMPFRFGGCIQDKFGLRCGFTSDLTIDRRDFGITFDRPLPDGTPSASFDVQIRLDIEVVQAVSG